MRGSGTSDVWIFAYGSLLWRPGFEYRECVPGYVLGWARRFWQGSPDHRGVPEAPGRVVTLAADPGAECWGAVYRLAGDAGGRVLRDLDHRERGGYERRLLDVQYAGMGRGRVSAVTYIAYPSNPHYLGPAAIRDIAAQIRRARGPSGDNVEYLLRLEAALEGLGVRDAHVAELAAQLRLAAPPERERERTGEPGSEAEASTGRRASAPRH